MNTTLKATMALGSAGLSLLGMAGGASAQATIGDPSLTTVFSTYNGKGAPSFTTGAVGVGYDTSGGGGKLPNSPTSATAQSVYEAFTFDSSAAGAFSTLGTGSKAQIEVFAANRNVNIGSNFDIYASLYAYKAGPAGTVPVTGPNLFGAEQKIILAPAAGGYFSGDFSLTGSIVAGQNYVLGITTLSSDTQDFAQVAGDAASQAGLTPTDFAFAKNKFLTDNNDQGGPTVSTGTLTTNNVIAFELNAASAAPVPEASMSLDFALGLGVLGAALVAATRRRMIAK